MALGQAEKKFRRIRRCGAMKHLVAALDAHQRRLELANGEAIA